MPQKSAGLGTAATEARSRIRRRRQSRVQDGERRDYALPRGRPKPDPQVVEEISGGAMQREYTYGPAAYQPEPDHQRNLDAKLLQLRRLRQRASVDEQRGVVTDT